MRVLHVASSMGTFYGGIERYVVTLANASVPTDEVLVAAPQGSPISVHCRVPTLSVRLTRKFDLAALVVYRRIFRQQKYDLVVVHFSPDYVVPALAARLAGGAACVLTRHVVVPFKGHRTKLYSKLYKGFVGVSQSAAQALLDSGLPSGLVRAVHGGCEPLHGSEKSADDRNRFRTSGFSVGTFGRLVQEKGIDTMIEARRVAKSPWSLHIFGDGPDRRRLETLSSGLDVHFHGHSLEVGPAMNAVDIVAMPSRWSEAFSIAALEALSLGKPLVASNVGGLPELFQDATPGVLVASEDASAFAAAIDAYASEPERAKDHGHQGQVLYNSTYTPDHMAVRLRSAYQELMAR